MEIATTGEYICTNFNPVINEVYVLTVVHNRPIYTARRKSVSAIKIVQNNEGGFTGKKLRSKRSIMTQQTSLIIICINTVIQVNQ
jgi:hypothetical protein